MSLSDQSTSKNPAKRFLKIKSGAVSFYDKEAGENIEVPTPFEFIVLDTLATIKGWSDADNSGFWSNEVRKVGSDELTIRTSQGVKGTGVWKDIKGQSSLAGAKYNSSIYIATKGRDGLEINNLALSGAALNAWIEFTKANSVTKNKIVLSDWADAKKGAVKYKTPVFTAVPFEDDEREDAITLDLELKEYFNEYFSDKDEAHVPAKNTKDVIVDDIDDEPIDLSEIPF